MILSGKSIEEAIRKDLIVIVPFNPANLKEASYTFTLQDEMVLQLGEFKIGLTKEKITLAQSIACFLSTRGSVAQMGVDALQSSTFVEPGSDNQLKLEIRNNSKETVTLVAGTKIVKGIFLEVH